jgi:MFS family permease
MAESEFERRERHARIYLITLSALFFLAACTATATYSYPETFGPWMRGLIIAHDAIGDIAIVVSLLYITNHLKKTWKMRRATVSRYTGLVVVGMWVITSLTGIYGHFYDLTDGSLLWQLHFVTSVAIIVLACFHGVWAYRPRKQGAAS